MSDRFIEPTPGPAASVRLPAIERSTLPNGVRVWTLAHRALPIVSATLLIDSGTVDDPADLPGLTSLTVDMLDEGAGGRDAIQLAESLADIGASLDFSSGSDAISAQVWTIRRHLAPALALLGDMVMAPHFADADLARVRDLRLSRLTQLRRAAPSSADRALIASIYGTHGYGHPGLGTSASITRATLNDIRGHHAAAIASKPLTLIVVGDIDHGEVVAMTRDVFSKRMSVTDAAQQAGADIIAPPTPRIVFVEREGAPQSELRVAQLSVPRLTPDYHALLLLNAGLGGSFAGRLNQRLRQQLGYTYGARSAFDLDRRAGMFVCDSSVQGDKTADSVREIHALIADVRGDSPLTSEELNQARGSLTRGYARNFETPRQLSGALAQLHVYGLPDDTFNTFVEKMEAVTTAEVEAAAQRHLDPSQLVTIVVGEAKWRGSLQGLGLPVETMVVEF